MPTTVVTRPELRRRLLPWVQSLNISRRHQPWADIDPPPVLSDNEVLEALLEIIIGPWAMTAPESTEQVQIGSPDFRALVAAIVEDSGVPNSITKLTAASGEEEAYRRIVKEQGFYVLVQVDLLLKAMDFLKETE